MNTNKNAIIFSLIILVLCASGYAITTCNTFDANQTNCSLSLSTPNVCLWVNNDCCAATGSTCSIDADCCGELVCTNNTCVYPAFPLSTTLYSSEYYDFIRFVPNASGPVPGIMYNESQGMGGQDVKFIGPNYGLTSDDANGVLNNNSLVGSYRGLAFINQNKTNLNSEYLLPLPLNSSRYGHNMYAARQKYYPTNATVIQLDVYGIVTSENYPIKALVTNLNDTQITFHWNLTSVQQNLSCSNLSETCGSDLDCCSDLTCNMTTRLCQATVSNQSEPPAQSNVSSVNCTNITQDYQCFGQMGQCFWDFNQGRCIQQACGPQNCFLCTDSESQCTSQNGCQWNAGNCIMQMYNYSSTWNGFSFNQVYAGNGPDKNYITGDLEELRVSTNSTHIALDIKAFSYNETLFCNSSLNYSFALDVDDDANLATGSPLGGQYLPGADNRVRILATGNGNILLYIGTISSLGALNEIYYNTSILNSISCESQNRFELKLVLPKNVFNHSVSALNPVMELISYNNSGIRIDSVKQGGGGDSFMFRWGDIQFNQMSPIIANGINQQISPRALDIDALFVQTDSNYAYYQLMVNNDFKNTGFCKNDSRDIIYNIYLNDGNNSNGLQSDASHRGADYLISAKALISTITFKAFSANSSYDLFNVSQDSFEIKCNDDASGMNMQSLIRVKVNKTQMNLISNPLNAQYNAESLINTTIYDSFGAGAFSSDFMFSWLSFNFPNAPYAANGMNVPANKEHGDLGAVFMTTGSYGSAGNYLALQIFAAGFTNSTFCNDLGVYTNIAIDIDKDNSKLTGCNSTNCMPGADYRVVIDTADDISFYKYNMSTLSWVNQSEWASLILWERSDPCPSSPPSIFRIGLPLQALNMSMANVPSAQLTVVSADINGTIDFLYPGIVNFASGGQMGIGNTPVGCPAFNGNRTKCERSSIDYGIACTWSENTALCNTNFQDMNDCAHFCGQCHTQSNCTAPSLFRNQCQWMSQTSTCVEQFNQMIGSNCENNCANCPDEYSCINKGPKDGLNSKCSWVLDQLSPNGGFCNYKEFNTFKDCNQNCYACDFSECSTSSANCTLITSATQWDILYNVTYDGFIGCVFNQTKELCMFPGDEDGNGLADCQDTVACSQDPFCGFGAGLSQGFNGSMGMNQNCYIKDNTNETACEAVDGCFWHKPGFPEGDCTVSGSQMCLCDPKMKAMMSTGMFSDSPPKPIGNDALDSSVSPWLDIIEIGIKDSQDSLGVGVGVLNISNFSGCKQFYNNSEYGKYRRYLDIDNNVSTGCSVTLSNGSTLQGFEYRLTHTGSGVSNNTINESKDAAKCVNGTFVPFSAQLTLITDECTVGPQFAPILFRGVNMLLVKKTDIGNPTGTMRIFTSTLNSSGSIIDTAGPFYYGAGTIDFTPNNCFADPTSCGSAFVSTGGKYMPFEDCMGAGDEDMDGKIGSYVNGVATCNDEDCFMTPWCFSVYNASSDKTAPTVLTNNVIAFKDFTFIDWNTNEPANGTVELYSIGAYSCNPVNITNKFVDIGMMNNPNDDYKPFHHVNILHNGTDSYGNTTSLQNNVTYYYKTISCDRANNCAYSGCLNFTTALTTQNSSLPFVMNYVPPVGQGPTDPLGNLNLMFDLNGDGTPDQNLSNNASTTFNATSFGNLVITNSNATNAWSITLNGINLAKAQELTMTDMMIVRNVSLNSTSTNIVGMNSTLWQNLAQNFGVQNVTITIPNGGNMLYKCDESGSNCVEVTSQCNLTLNSSNSTSWNCPVSLGFSTFAVYMAQTVATTSTSPSGGGGGSGGAISLPSLSTTEKTQTMTNGQKVEFMFNRIKHSITIKSLTEDTATIIIASSPSTYTLKVGESAQKDLDDDGKNDIQVTLINIFGRTVKLSYKSISQSTAKTTTNTSTQASTEDATMSGGETNTTTTQELEQGVNEESIDNSNKTVSDENTTSLSEPEQKGEFGFGWAAIGIILLIVIAGYFVYTKII